MLLMAHLQVQTWKKTHSYSLACTCDYGHTHPLLAK